MALEIDRPSAPALPPGVAAGLISLAALLAILLALHLLRPHFDLPLSAVRVDGELRHLDAAQIAAAADLPLGQRLFEADVGAVRRRVEALPWVAHARVTRLWPDRIAIRVWERQPVARWGAAGLVDADNRSFVPAAGEIPDGLPRLAGPEGREADVVGAYRALVDALGGSPFAPAALSLDARGEWTAETAAGIVLRFGSDDPAASAPMLLGPASRALTEHLEQVASIDLHYTNGFAVGWKNGVAPFAKPGRNRSPAAATPPLPPPTPPPAAQEPPL